MIRNILFGREYEKQKLNRCLETEQAQLILVYGRRRVGKTYLIHKFFNGRFDFRLTGIYNQPKSVQLENFSYELNRQSGRFLWKTLEGEVYHSFKCEQELGSS